MAANPLVKFRTFFFEEVLGIERHEYVAVAWSFAYFFFVLSSYYMIRPIRESMAVGSGPNTIPLLFTGTFVVTLLVTPVYGWIASRFPRRVFLPWIYIFFVTNILLFWVVFSRYISDGQDHVWLGRIFFVWISVFNLFVVSVFWSFMADIYTREQGRRLFGVIAAGGSFGAAIGSSVTSLLVVNIGFANLFPISAALLSCAVICLAKLRHWAATDPVSAGSTSIASDRGLGGNPFSGITHVFRSPYFGGIVAKSIIASLLGTALYLFAARLVEVEIAGDDARTAFYSNINVASSIFALLGQMFLVGRVVRIFGIGVALVIMPLVSIAGFVFLAITPMLWVVAFLTAARRAIGFAFAKPATDMLYSVASDEDKYKTKNFIDLAVYRLGDLITVWTVNPLIVAFGLTMVSIAMLPFATAWVFIALWLGRDYRRQAKALKESGLK